MAQINLRYLLPALSAIILLLTLPGCRAEDGPTATERAAEAAPSVSSAPGAPLDAAAWAALLPDLLSANREIQTAARERLAASGDPRAIAVLIELLRGAQIGLVLGPPEVYGAALDELSGEAFGTDWAEWIEWYGATEMEPPPGFIGWKGQMLARIDPGFAEFLYDGAPSALRPEEIQWGGVVIDGIPALDNPAMLSAAEAGYLSPAEPVFGIEINGDARAYPLRILDWHEMANDVVGGVPVSIAYCTLCGAAIAYDDRAANGEVYDFGSSGFLYRSNKLMYDRQTRTLWNQLTGKPVLGPLVEQDVTLDILPIVLTSWADWQAQHLDTQVLDINTGYERTYELGAAYGDYFAAEGTMFPVWQRADLLADKAQIYALNIGGVPKAYPLELLTAEQVVNDTVGETAVVLVAARGIVEAAGERLRGGPVSYQAGAEVRAFERGEHSFAAGLEPDVVVDESGASWEVREDGLYGPEGESLPRLPGHLAYWFGWFAFFPQTLVYGQE